MFSKKVQFPIVSVQELTANILEKKEVPIPLYDRYKEWGYIAQPRGTIFAKLLKRRKPPKV